MNLLKNTLKIFTVSAMLLTTNALASDFLVEQQFSDTDTGSGSWWGNDYAYNINQMNVQWSSDNQITVDIYTNFVEHNNENSAGGSNNIVFGDLLISTNGESTPFNYAFALTDGREDNYSNVYNSGNQRKWNKNWDNDGVLTEIDSTLSSKDYHGVNSNTLNGEVMAGTTVGTGVEGDWSVTNYGWKNETALGDLISFSFNVDGISAFQNATQVAFSWGMSCANDIVEGVVNIDRPTSVPEPTTLVLMLLALGFMAKHHYKKSDNFSA